MGSIFETTFSQIEYFYPKTRLSIVVFAVLLSTSIIPSSIINIFAILVVVSIGLMHGATDHILYINSDVAEFKSKIPKSFIIKYLFILAAMGLVWLLFPTMALILFLLISAYHFGQTQLQYLEISESDWRKKFYYTSWGFLVLCLIVLLNLEESKALINSAIPTLNLEIITFETADMTILSGSL